MSILAQLRQFLEGNHVHYEVTAHRQAFTAQEVAETEHVPGMMVAKVVMLCDGPDFLMAVLPAPFHVDLDGARHLLGRPRLDLAKEDQFAGLFPGCEPGAMPPLGNLWNVPVWVDTALTHDEEIVFNAGTHTETVRMRYSDFAHLVKPNIAPLALED